MIREGGGTLPAIALFDFFNSYRERSSLTGAFQDLSMYLTEPPLVHCVKVIEDRRCLQHNGELCGMYILHNIDMKIEEPI